MLASTIGDIRTGKTLLQVILALNTIRKHVYANFHLKGIKNFTLLEDPQDLENIKPNSDIYLDEVYAWLESRSHGRNVNKFISYILFQSGKRGLDFYLTAQLFSTVDVRFRDMSNIVVEVYKYEEVEMIEYNFYERQRGELVYMNTWYLPFNEAEQYYEFYDTYEIVEPYAFQDLKASMVIETGTKLLEKAQEYADKIKSGLERITHDAVKLELLKNNVNQKYEKYVYLVLKKMEEKGEL